MSGHNRWSKIKHAKALTDAKRSKGWSKALKEIAIAAKGGGDPAGNARLRNAIDKARAVNVPRDTIERSIAKASGELGADSYEELAYEIYGPGGSAAIIEVLTDNRNRAASEIRKILERGNGKLAAAGAVSYLFHKRGHIVFETGSVDENALMEAALELGAEDVRAEGDVFVVVTEAGKMLDVKDALEKRGLSSVLAEVGMYPENTVRLEGREAAAMVKLVQNLEDHDDVQNVYANYDVDDAVFDEVGAG